MEKISYLVTVSLFLYTDIQEHIVDLLLQGHNSNFKSKSSSSSGGVKSL